MHAHFWVILKDLPLQKTLLKQQMHLPEDDDSHAINLSAKHTLQHAHKHTAENSYLTCDFPGDRVFNSNNAVSNHLHASP